MHKQTFYGKEEMLMQLDIKISFMLMLVSFFSGLIFMYDGAPLMLSCFDLHKYICTVLVGIYIYV